MPAVPVEHQQQEEEDPVEIVLAWHDGDVHAAINTLLQDCAHLRAQLDLTTVAMSRGFTRGWMPSAERNSSQS